MLKDVQTFVAALDTMFGGFRERADTTYRLLQAPGTAFVVVAAPERDALREASYFVERLGEEGMPLAGLVLNRVHSGGAQSLSAERALAGAETLDELGDHPLAAGLLRLHAERARGRRARARRRRARPGRAAGDRHRLCRLTSPGGKIGASTGAALPSMDRPGLCS